MAPRFYCHASSLSTAPIRPIAHWVVWKSEMIFLPKRVGVDDSIHIHVDPKVKPVTDSWFSSRGFSKSPSTSPLHHLVITLYPSYKIRRRDYGPIVLLLACTYQLIILVQRGSNRSLFVCPSLPLDSMTKRGATLGERLGRMAGQVHRHKVISKRQFSPWLAGQWISRDDHFQSESQVPEGANLEKRDTGSTSGTTMRHGAL